MGARTANGEQRRPKIAATRRRAKLGARQSMDETRRTAAYDEERAGSGTAEEQVDQFAALRRRRPNR